LKKLERSQKNIKTLEVDECSAKTHNCDANAGCTNNVGSFACSCNSGYSGDGLTCNNVDECTLATHDCDTNASCTDTAGSFTCKCAAGYDGTGKSCAGKISTGEFRSEFFNTNIFNAVF